MKNLLFVPISIVLLSCQTQSGLKNTSGPEYSENHLDFKSWNRTSDCCTAKGKSVAISSGGTRSSKAGIEIYKAGGNVVDAAIAVAFALSVERPHSAGLGGGAFMTLYLKAKKQPAHFIDFRESAPAKATRDMYLGKDGNVIKDLSVKGALSVATPGFVQGLYDIHKKWGKLAWAKLLVPAIILAEEGIEVYPSLAKHIIEEKECLLKDPESSKLLFKNGVELKTGEKLVQKDLAATLRRIAKNGEAEFRTGKTAKAITGFLASRGGIVSISDLKNYQVKYREPIQGKFKDLQFYSAPPPSAGGVLIAQMLKVLEKLEVEKYVNDSTQYAHLLSEVMKRAYADRSSFVGDPDFFKADYKKLMDTKYTDMIAAHINMEQATPSSEIRGGAFLTEGNHTTHFNVIDSNGNAVASTMTINDTFGACLIVPGTGVFLNDEMDDFSAKPGAQNIYGLTGSEANAVGPLKRPASSMSPTIVLKDGVPIFGAGAAGGSRITTSVLQVLLNNFYVFKGDLKKSMFAPRLHQQWIPEFLDLEDGYSEGLKENLVSRGQKIRKPPFSAIVQSVSKSAEGEFTAVFDPRDEGGAEAY